MVSTLYGLRGAESTRHRSLHYMAMSKYRKCPADTLSDLSLNNHHTVKLHVSADRSQSEMSAGEQGKSLQKSIPSVRLSGSPSFPAQRFSALSSGVSKETLAS